jgi:hypothetical protein
MAAASPTKSPTKEPKKKSLSVAVGDRVKVDGYESVGTVRYVGPHKVTVHTPACCVLCAIHQRADAFGAKRTSTLDDGGWVGVLCAYSLDIHIRLLFELTLRMCIQRLICERVMCTRKPPTSKRCMCFTRAVCVHGRKLMRMHDEQEH